MYQITKISHEDRQHGVELLNNGKYQEARVYLREHVEVLGEFDNSPEARQFWRALGLNLGANYHETDGVIYRMGVARTD